MTKVIKTNGWNAKIKTLQIAYIALVGLISFIILLLISPQVACYIHENTALNGSFDGECRPVAFLLLIPINLIIAFVIGKMVYTSSQK